MIQYSKAYDTFHLDQRKCEPRVLLFLTIDDARALLFCVYFEYGVKQQRVI